MEFSKEACLIEEDFYCYISGQGSTEKLRQVEAHLARCSRCRQDLAGLLEILYPDAEQAVNEWPEPSSAELDQAIATINKVSRREHFSRKGFAFWPRWSVAAAAVIFAAFGILCLKYLYEISRSGAFFSEAKAILEQHYAGRSPSNLRLTLPFHSMATSQREAGPESLRQAETLFFQAIAFRENMVEAHLGLACIYLNESQPARAQAEFQKVLSFRKKNIPALIGRGVSQYEEAIRNSDPVRRNALLAGALDDFDAVLQLDPNSSEARYNRIWTLFESGLHKEALQEIESYLSRDPGSIWAEELRGLKAKMRATQISTVQEDVRRSALKRDEAALGELVKRASYQIPAAISFALKQSLESEGVSGTAVNPNPEDFRWAAETMETAYRASTGDSSLKAFLDFYVGLSPPQLALKRILDREFQNLDDLYRAGKFSIVLRSSKPLENRYTTLKDFWQLADLHHLRGNSFYLGMADFDAAEAEFRKMLEIADRVKASDLMAKAMGSLAMICGVQRRFDDSLSYAHQLKDFADSHNLASYQIYALITLGDQFRHMGQFEKSLHEYTAALGMAYRLLDGMKILEILEDLGTLMERFGRIREAQDFYRLALKQQNVFLESGLVQRIPEVTIRRLNLLLKQGELALRTGDVASAERLFQESLQSTPSGMHELEGRNRIGLAEIYLDTKRIGQAENMLQSLTAAGASDRYPELGWKTKSLKGRLFEQTGNHREALLSLQQAIEILERMRQQINAEDWRQSFLAYRFDPFKTMIALLHESHGNNGKTLQYVDRAKSITLKEHLRLLDSELELRGKEASGEKSGDEYPILEYFFAEKGLLIFLTRGKKTEAVLKSISAEELSGLIRDYLESVRVNETKSFTRMARRLYDELIAPVEKHAFADSPETLVILPDGPLHLLPFAGLQDPQGHFLIEKVPLAFAASRSVFRHCLLLNKRRTDDNFNVTLIDGSANLPSAREELVYISKLYGKDASILSPRELSAFRQAVAQSEIVHFSGHAINAQGKPALLLQSSPSEIHLDCKTIGTWKMPRTYLVNLAGCSTGIGPISEGEAPWGLIPAFLNAGVPAVIASLMPVDDASTMRLSCRFYDLLQRGVSKAQALQRAQLGLLDSARSNSDIKPQSWIPYILVGNPQ